MNSRDFASLECSGAGRLRFQGKRSQSAGMPRTPKASPDSQVFSSVAKRLECGVFRRFGIVAAVACVLSLGANLQIRAFGENKPLGLPPRVLWVSFFAIFANWQ